MSDDPPAYSDDEIRQIVTNHLGLAREVHAGEWRGRRIDRNFLCGLHARLFDAVRPQHAGRHRDRGRGSEDITFGNPRRRSEHRDRVGRCLDDLCAQIQRSVDACRASEDDPAYARSVVRLAVWAHVELIRIHPFQDGNGRTARMLLCALFVELGLRAVPTEVPRKEYLEALRHHDEARDLDPLIDIYLMLLASVLPDEPGA